MTYPTRTWDQFEALLKRVGENRHGETEGIEFLKELALIEDEGSLTQIGRKFFNEHYINKNEKQPAWSSSSNCLRTDR